MKRFKGTFTNQEIIVYVLVIFAAGAIGGFQWRAFFAGACLSVILFLGFRDIVNMKVRLKPWAVRILRREVK